MDQLGVSIFSPIFSPLESDHLFIVALAQESFFSLFSGTSTMIKQGT